MCKRRTCTQPSNVRCLECYEDKIIWDRRSSDTTCERLCSFANHYCWPGTCGNGLANNCQCAPGFKLVKRTGSQIFSGETTCQIDTKPAIDYCRTVFVGANGEKKDTKSSTSSNECKYLQDTYGNYQLSTIEFDMMSSFTIDTTAFAYSNKPTFIREHHFGISDTTLLIYRKPLTGTDLFLSRHYLQKDTFSSTHVTNNVANNGNVSVATSTYTVSNGQSLCLTYEAKAGGYLKSYDARHSNISGPIQYTKVSSQRQLCFRYDDAPPEHCVHLKSCSSGEPLNIANRVTRDPISEVSFTGWSDPIPTGGSTKHASSLESYEISVHKVIPRKGLQMVDGSPVYSRKVGSSSSITSITLNLMSKRPMLYCIQLEVKDVADNIRQARRFVLYDNTTYIETKEDELFLVTSASQATSYVWQTHDRDICLNWANHFHNRYYLDNAMLDPVKQDSHGLINGIYEQADGLLPVKGTPNVAGIVNFKISWSLNNGNYSNEIDVPDFLNQNFCRNFNVKDGQKYTFNIRPIDIVGNSFQEHRSVHIDRSNPHIQNIRLEKDGFTMVFVDFTNNFSVTSMTFEALDPHSGIKEIKWGVGISNTQMELVSKYVGVNTLNTTCTVEDETCYCPSFGVCERYIYSVHIDQLDLNVTRIGYHARNSTFTVKVTNNAELSTVEQINVIVDNSPPEKGVVYAGRLDPNNFTFPILWFGFNDIESGLRSFHLGLSQRCLSNVELYRGNIPDIEFYIELDSLSSFMNLSANFTGKRYITIIALNNALTPSEAVCSSNPLTGLFPEVIDNEPVTQVNGGAIGGAVVGCVLLVVIGVTVTTVVFKRRRAIDKSKKYSRSIGEESGYENVTVDSGRQTHIYAVVQQACGNSRKGNKQEDKDKKSDSLYTDLDTMNTIQQPYEEINMAVIRQTPKEAVYDNLQIRPH